MACGIFLDQGLNLCPLHWQADSYPVHHRGSAFRGIHLKRWESTQKPSKAYAQNNREILSQFSTGRMKPLFENFVFDSSGNTHSVSVFLQHTATHLRVLDDVTPALPGNTQVQTWREPCVTYVWYWHISAQPGDTSYIHWGPSVGWPMWDAVIVSYVTGTMSPDFLDHKNYLHLQ